MLIRKTRRLGLSSLTFHNDAKLAVRASIFSHRFFFNSAAKKFRSRVSSNPIAIDKRFMSIDLYNSEFKEMRGPKLAVLEKSYNYLRSLPEHERPDFSKTLFICGEHLLDSTISLFEYYIKLGAKPENIYVIGKSYSNNLTVIEKLKELKIQYVENDEQDTLGVFSESYDSDIAEMIKQICARFNESSSLGKPNIDGVIVADDGGHVLAKIRSNKFLRTQLKYIVGIEQTSSGVDVSRETQYPVIEVASSAAKKLLEPAMVSEKTMSVVQKKLSELSEWKTNTYKDTGGYKKDFTEYFSLDKQPRCGIIGIGNIGIAILDGLIKMGYRQFTIFDLSIEKAKEVEEAYRARYGDLLQIDHAHRVSGIFFSADIIAGCTGKDITSEPEVMDAFRLTKTPKILFSCASKDKEFLTLLKYIQTSRRSSTDPLEDILFQNGYQAPLLIFRGGFPLNFDNSEVSVPNDLIQIIRGIKLLAAFQAYKMLANLRETKGLACENYKLDPRLQKIAIEAFLEDQPGAREKYCAEKGHSKLTDAEELGKLSSGKPYHMELPSPQKSSDISLKPGKR